MPAIDLASLDTATLMPTELAQLRHQLYQTAQHHEARAAAYWNAYWQTMGLAHRPLTQEQAALQNPTTVKPRGTPRPKRNTGVQVVIE